MCHFSWINLSLSGLHPFIHSYPIFTSSDTNTLEHTVIEVNSALYLKPYQQNKYIPVSRKNPTVKQ